MCGIDAAADEVGDENPGIKHRVATLEELTAQQQGDIDAIGQWIASHEDGGDGTVRVVANNGEVLGDFMGFFSSNLNFTAYTEIDGRGLILRGSRHGLWWDAQLLFTETDCTGQKYMGLHQLGHNWFNEVVMLAVQLGTENSRVPFIGIGGPREETILSETSSWGCQDYDEPQHFDVVPVTEVFDSEHYDMLEHFPPPYHLER